MRKYTIRTKQKGFTLLEIVVVIAIIGILAAILVPNAVEYIRKAKRTSDIASAKEIHNNVNIVLTENKRVETTGVSFGIRHISPYESFYYSKSGSSYNAARRGNLPQYIKIDDDGNPYTLIPVAYLDAASGKKWSTFTEDEKKPFVDALNAQMADSKGFVDIDIKYTPKGESNDLDRWYLVYRYQQRGMIEVWVGSSKVGSGSGSPLYRVYPDPTY